LSWASISVSSKQCLASSCVRISAHFKIAVSFCEAVDDVSKNIHLFCRSRSSQPRCRVKSTAWQNDDIYFDKKRPCYRVCSCIANRYQVTKRTLSSHCNVKSNERTKLLESARKRCSEYS
jgi:hypothetical protein